MLFSFLPLLIFTLASKFTLYFLMAFAPIFIFCVMWGFLKDTLANYLAALISNALTLLVLITIQKGIMEQVMTRASYNNTDVLVTSIIFMLMRIFMGILIKYIVSVISSIVRVSIERANTGFANALIELLNVKIEM